MSIICSYGAFLMMCSLTIVTSQDPQLTVTPNTAEAGDDVEMYCVFSDTSSAFTVSISDYETNSVIWQYTSPDSTISVGEAYGERVQHTPQLSYSSAVTITLTNVNRDDDGYYVCVLEKTNQQTLIGASYLAVHVPPQSMRVFVASPPPYIESQATLIPPYYTPVYTVNCTFSVYPSTHDVLWPTAIIRGNDRKESVYYTVENGNVYNVTFSAQFPLTRNDNGKKSVNCEVTWMRGTDREKIYTAVVEKPLNVTFSIPDISIDGLSRTTFTEGEPLSTTCSAGSANPSEVINWWIKTYIGTEGIEVTYEPGEYNGQKTVSTLRVTVQRWMDGEEVVCCLRDAHVCQRTRISVTSTSSPSEPPNSTPSPTLSVPTMGSTNTMVSTSVPPISGMSTQAPTTTSLSNMSSTTTSAVPYSESNQVTKTDLPVVDADSLLLSYNSETVTLSWATPMGDYDKMAVQQCERETDKCIDHEVGTGVNGLLLKVSPNIEYEFFMLLYQAGSVVIKAGPFVDQQEARLQDQRASNTGNSGLGTSGNAGAIAGGVVGGLVFIVLIVAVTVLILKRRRAILKSGKGTTSDVPVHVYENDGVLATTASQDDPPTSNAGEYEEIGEEAQSSRSNNVQHLYENQRHKENVEIESDYSGLGPREAPAPNVYDIISAYEN